MIHIKLRINVYYINIIYNHMITNLRTFII